MSEAHQLFLRRASYGPERLKILGRAFDDAWLTIAASVGDAPDHVRKAKTTLANVILHLQCGETADAEHIKNAAVQVMLDAGPLVFQDGIYHPGSQRPVQQR